MPFRSRKIEPVGDLNDRTRTKLSINMIYWQPVRARTKLARVFAGSTRV